MGDPIPILIAPIGDTSLVHGERKRQAVSLTGIVGNHGTGTLNISNGAAPNVTGFKRNGQRRADTHPRYQ
jgi:T5SS/PEP-CTERM-associated repeat protein